MRAILLRASRALFANQTHSQKKNIFRLPQRHEFNFEAQDETYTAIITSPSCTVLAITLRDNIDYFTHNNIWMLYNHLRTYQLQIDKSFHQIIAPISLEYLKVFNREQAYTMYEMIITMIDLKIQNVPLWDALINKLDNQNCYRYIPLLESSSLLNRLLDSPQHAKLSLTRKLISVLYQHNKFFLTLREARPTIDHVLEKLSKLEYDGPKLTEAYKQLK